MMPVQILDGIWGRSIIGNAVLDFCAMLDRIFFAIFGWVMQGIFDVASVEIISSSVYQEFQNRVYVILGIFMLFKVTVSLLTYLVSPDKINDKERGMGKMVTRTIVVICMLVGLPFAFNLLDRAQPILLEAIPRIIIGKDTSTGTTSNQMNGVADMISWTTFQISLNEDTVALMESEGINTVAGATSVITEPNPTDYSEYKYFYFPLIGTLVAIVMSFLMIGMGIDIAIRSFKLVILRMIAPVPIISYIDPKSAKDGAFSNWTKTLISTWLDLFIRLGILYFVLYMIDTVLLSKNISLGSGSFIRTTVVTIFIIIGLMFFARQAPKFITDALGIKNSKGMGVGLGGMLAAGGASLAGGGLAGMLKASGDYMNEAADSAAQGKAPGPSWSKGRDVAAQLRTGDSGAKGKTFAQKGFDQLLRLNARAHGFTDDKYDKNGEQVKEGTVTQAKNAMYRAKDAASNVSVLRNKVMEGHRLNQDEIDYMVNTFSEQIVDMNSKGNLTTTRLDQWNTNDWNNFVNAQNTNAAKAEKYYQKAEKYAASRGVRTERPLADDLGLQSGRFNPEKHDRKTPKP